MRSSAVSLIPSSLLLLSTHRTLVGATPETPSTGQGPTGLRILTCLEKGVNTNAALQCWQPASQHLAIFHSQYTKDITLYAKDAPGGAFGSSPRQLAASEKPSFCGLQARRSTADAACYNVGDKYRVPRTDKQTPDIGAEHTVLYCVWNAGASSQEIVLCDISCGGWDSVQC